MSTPWRYEPITARRQRDSREFQAYANQRVQEESGGGGGGLLGDIWGGVSDVGSAIADIPGVSEAGGAIADVYSAAQGQLQSLLGAAGGLTGTERRLDPSTGQYYRETGGFGDVLEGWGNLLSDPVGTWQDSETAYEEYFRNPEKGWLTRAASEAVVAPETYVTAGAGGLLGQGLRQAGPLGRLGANVVEPVAGGSFARRAVGELGLETGARAGSEALGERFGPAGSILGGLGGGLGGAQLGRAIPGSQPFRQAAQQAPDELGQATISGGAMGYSRGLRPFSDVVEEVKTLPNEQLRQVMRRSGASRINPSLVENTDVGKGLIAYQRQRVASEQLAETAVESAIGKYRPRGGIREAAGPRGSIFQVDEDASIRNLEAGEGQSRTWQDVFSRPSQYNLGPQQRAYVDDFNQVIADMELLRAEEGLPPLPKNDDGSLYVPRQVKGVREADLDRPSNPKLQRIYEEAQEGVANGVRYDTDPRNTLNLYVRATYKEMAEKQLSDFLEPHSVTARELVPEDVKDQLKTAIKQRQFAEAAVRAERGQVIRNRRQVDKDIKKGLQRYGRARMKVESLKSELKGRATITERAGRRSETLRGQAEQLRADKMRSPQGFPEARINMPPTGAEQARAAGREQTAGEINRATGRSTPLSFGERMRQAQADVEAAQAELKRLEQRSRELPRITSRTSKPFEGISDETANRLEEAKKAHGKAKKQYARSREAASQSKIANEGVFEPLRIRVRDANAVLQKKATAARKMKAGPEKDIALAEAEDARVELQQAQRALEEAKKNVDGPLFGETSKTIPVQQWRNRFYRREDAERIAEVLDPQQARPGAISRAVETTGNLVRTAAATGDFAMPFTHGLTVLARNPIAWSKMTAKHYQAFFDPSTQARYVERNVDTINEMASYGVPIHSDEFFIGLEDVGRLGRNLPEGVKRVGGAIGEQTAGRFQASYQTGLTIGRAEMWKAMSPSWKGSKNELGAYIRNMTGGMDTRALGVSPTQRAWESMWLAFSPRLFRSTAALIAKASNPRTVEGRESLRSLGQLAGGAAGLYVASGLLLGKDWEEIEQGLNPLNGKKFLSHEVNGDWIGIGGQVRAISQFVARSVETTATDPMAFASTDQFENPLIAFFMSRGAPGVNLALGSLEAASGGEWDTMKYDDIASVPDLFKHVGTSAMPFALQGMLEGESAVTSAVSFVGARTSPGTATDKLNEVAQRQFEEDFYDLEPYQQDAIKLQRPELWEEAVEQGSKERQEAETVRQQLAEEQESDDQLLLSGDISLDQWKDSYHDRGLKLRTAQEHIYGNFESEEETPLDRYYEAIEQSKVNGRVDWDAVERWKQEQGDKDRKYIERNTGIGGDTPLVRAYRATSDERDKYYSLPKYSGYTGDEARQIDDLYNRARAQAKGSSNRGVSQIRMLRAIRDAGQEFGYDEKVIRGARRRIIGMMTETKDRERFLQENPLTAVFIGRDYLSADDAQELATSLS